MGWGRGWQTPGDPRGILLANDVYFTMVFRRPPWAVLRPLGTADTGRRASWEP